MFLPPAVFTEATTRRQFFEEHRHREVGLLCRLPDLHVPLLIGPDGFCHAKLLHPRQHPLPQQGCFRIGRAFHQPCQFCRFVLRQSD